MANAVIEGNQGVSMADVPQALLEQQSEETDQAIDEERPEETPEEDLEETSEEDSDDIFEIFDDE